MSSYPLERLSEAELVRTHSNQPVDNHFPTEMLQRHKQAPFACARMRRISSGMFAGRIVL